MQPSKRKRIADGGEDTKENAAVPGEAQKASKRRKRTRYEPSQVAVLKASFERDAYPGIQELQRLERLLGIREDRLSVWFQNRRARHPNSSEPNAEKPTQTKTTNSTVPQSQPRVIPFAAAQSVASQPTWPGNTWNHSQPGQPLGQYLPSNLYQQHLFPQGTGQQYESTSFETGCAQNLPFSFGSAEHCAQLQQQQSQQGNASWDSCVNYNSYSGQYTLCSVENQQLGQQAPMAQYQDSAWPVNESGPVVTQTYIEENGSYAQSSSSGNSPLLFGGEAQMGQEYSPTSTYSNSQSSPSSITQWARCGILPNQNSPY